MEERIRGIRDAREIRDVRETYDHKKGGREGPLPTDSRVDIE